MMENLSQDQKVDIAVSIVNILVSAILYLLAVVGAVSVVGLFVLIQASDFTEQPIQKPQDHHIITI